ncbi:DUF58 domain-containing protein [Haloarchaeobius sp. HME9146]|uniref:DUF58 domain-containing protein n=1 Tax=Haloarchaeobius sp. HME9146 TaxID=2978732 RepID=UPI0021C12451|nr:DUF58 domain-containing protein [Haloarchaeobius sp. HME9146]MCT9095689.1 DUF58 domain-containing protein [Haloarchaeobius sp. HME9146]
MSRTRTTRRWRGVVSISLVAMTIGVVANRPDVLLVSLLGVVYAAYPRLTSPPEPSLAIERALSDEDPDHGDPVEVTVTVTNTGDRPLPDLRLVDGVPEMLTVTDGMARHGASLRAGGSTTFSYTVEAKRGTYPFDPATVVSRDLSGEHEVETTVAASTEIDCTQGIEGVTARSQTLARSGQVVSDTGGSGVEFHRTREYQRGDPLNRIDWNRYARTGDLSTTEFRTEQAASVVCLVDARPAAYRARPDHPHAVALCTSAAEQIVGAFAADRNQVGVAAFYDDLVWHPVGMGPTHRASIQRLLTTHEAFSSKEPDETPDTTELLADLRHRLTERTQVVLLSPLCDDDIVETARRLEEYGHAVTVVTPDVTGDETVGQRLASVQRAARIRTLRGAGIPTSEWRSDEPLEAALATQGARAHSRGVPA